MKDFAALLKKHIDFHFALALIAVFGTAASLFLQFSQANTEFDILNGSIYSVVRSRESDSEKDAVLHRELENLEKALDELNLN